MFNAQESGQQQQQRPPPPPSFQFGAPPASQLYAPQEFQKQQQTPEGYAGYPTHSPSGAQQQPFVPYQPYPYQSYPPPQQQQQQPPYAAQQSLPQPLASPFRSSRPAADISGGGSGSYSPMTHANASVPGGGYAAGTLHPTVDRTREEYAQEAVQASSQHWIAEQLRRSKEGPAAAVGYAPRFDADGNGDANNMESEIGERERLLHTMLMHRQQQQKQMGVSGADAFSADLPALNTVEFVVGSPRYQRRLAVLLICALFGMIPLMSSLTLTVALCGVMAVYMSDFLGYRRGTVLVILLAVSFFGLSLFLTNFQAAITSFGPVLLMVDICGIFFMAAAAALLHFRWLQETFPELICTLERLVMATTPVLALPLLLATIIAICGARYAPFFFLVTMCLEHYFFFTPLVSSYMVVRPPSKHAEDVGSGDATAGEGSEKSKKAAKKLIPESAEEVDREGMTPQQVNGRTEAIIFSFLMILFPSVVYNGLQSNWEDHVITNLLNSLGLVCGAISYLCVSPGASLWFLAPAHAHSAAIDDDEVDVLSRLEYDPLGLRDVVDMFRLRVLGCVAVLGTNWVAYRFLNSRYGYIFDGVPYPFNFFVLLIALYLTVFVAFKVKVLLDGDRQGEQLSTARMSEARIITVVGSIVVVVLFCILGDTPGVFYLPAVLSVTSFNLFLFDRTNGGPMVSFIIFSSLQLMWWMFRTFSFIVADLHVFGEATTVPTPVVAVSVLWCYVLGCLCFAVSFTANKAPLIGLLFLHALQVTWVEHVLYSQNEEGVYSGVLVFLTTAVGVFMAYRLYHNGVLSISAAAFVASCYVTKILTFFVEITSAYYYQADAALLLRDGSANDSVVTAAETTVGAASSQLAAYLLMTEITGGWWVGVAAGYVVVMFEIDRRKRIQVRYARTLVYLYSVCAVLLSGLTVRNLQRAVYEFLTQSYVCGDELPHIALGTSLVTFSFLTIPFVERYKGRYSIPALLSHASRASAVLGVVLLAIQPTRLVEEKDYAFDYHLQYAHKARYALFTGLCLLIGGRVLPLQKIPSAARVVYWLATAYAFTFGIAATLLPYCSIQLICCLGAFVFLMMLSVDLAHYRHLTSIEAWVVYGLGMVAMALSFITMHRTDLTMISRSYSAALVLEIHEQGRMQLLSIVAVSHLFVAIMVKCRLSGKPLLPHCVPLTEHMVNQLGVVCNYGVIIAVGALCVLNFWNNDNEPGLYATFSLMLLLLTDDGVLFYELSTENFRYFPSAIFLIAVQWACNIIDAWSSGLQLPMKVQQVGVMCALGLLVAPAQMSLLLSLWRGRKRGGATVKTVVLTIVLCAVVLLVSSSHAMHWMTIVAICGQSARLFGGQLHGKKRKTNLI